ncbi:MAG: glycoside hydrolase family 3 C-terminal domain-containing protein [Bacteroidota bacterium]
MKKLFLLITLLVLNACENRVTQETLPVFKDPSQSFEARIDDLISQMTLEEKVSQMRYDAPAIERLGVPAYNWWNECLHGVGRAGEATVFPQAIGMAAMWDSTLMHEIAVAISDEARAKHSFFANQGQRGIYQGLTFWTPNINIFRDPRWGRGQETYGEDPYLTGRLAVNFIKGLQGDNPDYLKVVATSKHFAVHSGPEKTRHSDNYHTSERDLWQTYLPAFEATIKEANVQSLMCAYNRFRDEACCGSHLLLDSILRNQWGFDGYVVSDCWAINDFYMDNRHGVAGSPQEAAALAVQRGTDLNCGDTFFPGLVDAVHDGLLPETSLDEALSRLILAKLKLGMFDPPESVSYNQIPYSVVRSDKHLDLALKASREALVLLKNENNILPLSKDLQKVAVIGPNAHDEQVLLGNYHGTALEYQTPFQAIKEKLPNATVVYELGSPIAEGFPLLKPVPTEYLSSEGEKGLKGEYFSNIDWSGTPANVQQDAQLDFKWTKKTPISGIMADTFAVKWSGQLSVPENGTYRIGIKACNFGKLTIGDSTYVEFDNIHHPITRYTDLDLKVGEAYDIAVDFYSYHTDPQLQLLWAKIGEDYLNPALKAAQEAEVIVLCLGLSPDIEGEEMPIVLEGFDKGDRTKLGLPQPQIDLMKKVKALGKPTVLVLLNGSALAINWADKNMPAILESWYPGEFGGDAIADVLFGDYNPSGKLPVTFYKSVNDLPEFTDYSMNNRTYKYFKGEVLYPFGHGLSYTQFEYSDLKLPEQINPGEPITASVEVKNIGSLSGEEVVQLYVSHTTNTDVAPIRSLQGFNRMSLAAGESKTVNFTLSPKQYALIKQDGTVVIEPSEVLISVGGKQPGFKGNADAGTTQTVQGKVSVVGEPLKLALN